MHVHAICITFVHIAVQALAMYISCRSWSHWSHAEKPLLEKRPRHGLTSAACQHHTSTPLTRCPSS